MLLESVCQTLTGECVGGHNFDKSSVFENRVREVFKELADKLGLKMDFSPNPQVFPDIVLGKFGVEVKFTTNDTWRSIANSVFEGTRNQSVESIYVIFGKMGGTPSVKWGKYEECVIHVRTSHVPRFEVEIPQPDSEPRESLFKIMGVSYDEFCRLPLHDRMEHVRKYARGRLRPGERLWWLEDRPDQGHSLPLQARLYTSLSQPEKRKLRAEAALLCPEVVKSSRSRKKYDDAVLYLLTYRGVLCHQARDLFTAGSVAGPERGGNYMMRALRDIEEEMKAAAAYLEDALFVEYWERSVPPENRIREWLLEADSYALDWDPKPSVALFKDGY